MVRLEVLKESFRLAALLSISVMLIFGMFPLMDPLMISFRTRTCCLKELRLIHRDACVCVQVSVNREGEKISLIVDGINAQSKRIPSGDHSGLTSTLYVGGVPPALKVKQASPSCGQHERHIHLIGPSRFPVLEVSLAAFETCC